MTIIVGRGRSKATQRIEITDPTVSREHCWLTDNGDGTFTLQNKSPQGTFVDGRQVVKTRVTPNTYVQLSQSTIVKVADLLPQKPGPKPQSQPQSQPARGGSGQQPPAPAPEFSIKHLRGVWDEYHNTQLEIQKQQRSNNLMRSASPMFTLGSGAIATIAKTLGWGDAIFGITVVLTVIGLVLMIFSFYKGVKDDSIEAKERATEDFQFKYICPNPKCHHFMGNQSYHILRQNKNCPWCKCKFTT